MPKRDERAQLEIRFLTGFFWQHSQKKITDSCVKKVNIFIFLGGVTEKSSSIYVMGAFFNLF
jgi:hypothetical protein